MVLVVAGGLVVVFVGGGSCLEDFGVGVSGCRGCFACGAERADKIGDVEESAIRIGVSGHCSVEGCGCGGKISERGGGNFGVCHRLIVTPLTGDWMFLTC